MKFIASLSYILLIVIVNAAFSYAPILHLFGSALSSADIIIGVIYIVRDFAQRELGHYVIIAMIIGCILSYFLAEPMVAFASVAAFIVGETIDWSVYTFTGKPLSQRLLWSSLLSIPIDTVLFLFLINQMTTAGIIVMTSSKAFGVMCIWLMWKFWYRTGDVGLQKAGI